MKTLIRIVTALACLGSLTTFPQSSPDSVPPSPSPKKNGITLHAGVALPAGDFASSDPDNEKGGGAATGINAGLRYTYRLAEGGLDLFVGADFLHHNLKRDVRDLMEAVLREGGVDIASITWYKYMVIPFSLGLRFEYPIDENISSQINGGISYNFLRINDFTVTSSNQSVVTEFDPARSLGGRIGAGIVIRDRFFLSANYLGLGQFDTRATVMSSGQYEEIDVKLPVRIVTITAGVRIW